MVRHAGRYFLRILGKTLRMSALTAVLALSAGACNNNQGGFSGSVGNTPPGPPLTSYRILGTPGTPFNATVSNARSSWVVQGNVPLSMVICNNDLPAEILATKTSSDNSLLSIEIINGNKVLGVASTTAPFGNVSEQTGGTLLAIAPPADPDLRILVAGPAKAAYQALVEDIDIGFDIEDRAPTLIFFDSPDGKVTGQFFAINRDFGEFTLDMTLNGELVATVVAGPNATIEEP
jgi:hypothetical protein